jgi:hypothetical protein
MKPENSTEIVARWLRGTSSTEVAESTRFPLKIFLKPNTDDTWKLKSLLERLCIRMVNVSMMISLKFVCLQAFCTISSEKSFARLAKTLLGWRSEPRGRDILRILGAI